ncbi:MAG: DNA mismatch repair protein MutS, partial [Candidatus Aminicenantales bacterium]
MAEKNSLTPMMEQYFRLKKKHQDAFLFFRLGDFYEMFYEDARTAAPLLEIALTSRQKVPMCGVPYHAVNSYLAKLLKHGYKVAICEQVEDARQGRGVVKREVVKVLTPGTAIEIELDQAKENTYIASLYLKELGWGLAVVNLSSGSMLTFQNESHDKRFLADELFKISPKEIVFPEGEEERVNQLIDQSQVTSPSLSPLEGWAFELAQAKNLLLSHFKVKSLAGFDLADKNLAVAAAGALLYYLNKVRKNSLSLIQSLSYHHAHDYLVLDATTIRNLELVRNLRDGRVKDSLLDIIDFTITSMGGRLLKSWLLQPLLDRARIEERLEAVAELVTRTIERHDLRERLKEIYDLERLTAKISVQAAHAKDLLSLKKSLEPLPQIQSLLTVFSAARLKKIHKEWDNGQDIAELIEKAIKEDPAFLLTEGGLIKDGYHQELDELRQISRSGKTYIASLEKKEKERTGISSLKIGYNKVFGYYIEVTN